MSLSAHCNTLHTGLCFMRNSMPRRGDMIILLSSSDIVQLKVYSVIYRVYSTSPLQCTQCTNSQIIVPQSVVRPSFMRILTFEEKITDDKTTDEWIDEWDCNERF